MGNSGNSLTVVHNKRYEDVDAKGRDIHTGIFYSTLTFEAPDGRKFYMRSDDPKVIAMVDKMTTDYDPFDQLFAK